MISLSSINKVKWSLHYLSKSKSKLVSVSKNKAK